MDVEEQPHIAENFCFRLSVFRLAEISNYPIKTGTVFEEIRNFHVYIYQNNKQKIQRFALCVVVAFEFPKMVAAATVALCLSMLQPNHLQIARRYGFTNIKFTLELIIGTTPGIYKSHRLAFVH